MIPAFGTNHVKNVTHQVKQPAPEAEAERFEPVPPPKKAAPKKAAPKKAAPKKKGKR